MAEHWRKLFDKDNKNLGAWDLEVDGKFTQVIVTIDSFFQDVLVGSMGKENKVFVKLKEFQKPMICNPTNFKRLSKFFDTFDKDMFLGKQIVLGVEKVNSPEGQVDALRFSTRAIPNQTTATTLPVISDFDKALSSVSKGSITIEKILAKYTVSAEQLKQLQDAVQG